MGPTLSNKAVPGGTGNGVALEGSFWLAAALAEFASQGAFDLIHFCDLVMWPYVADLPGRHLRVMDRSRVDLLFQTEEAVEPEAGSERKMASMGKYLETAPVRAEGRRAIDRDGRLRHRRRDVSSAGKYASAQRIKVLPNGVDEEYFLTGRFPLSA